MAAAATSTHTVCVCKKKVHPKWEMRHLDLCVVLQQHVLAMLSCLLLFFSRHSAVNCTEQSDARALSLSVVFHVFLFFSFSFGSFVCWKWRMVWYSIKLSIIMLFSFRVPWALWKWHSVPVRCSHEQLSPCSPFEQCSSLPACCERASERTNGSSSRHRFTWGNFKRSAFIFLALH